MSIVLILAMKTGQAYFGTNVDGEDISIQVEKGEIWDFQTKVSIDINSIKGLILEQMYFNKYGDLHMIFEEPEVSPLYPERNKHTLWGLFFKYVKETQKIHQNKKTKPKKRKMGSFERRNPFKEDHSILNPNYVPPRSLIEEEE